jgi:mono/diheme cytochrome c family protein
MTKTALASTAALAVLVGSVLAQQASTPDKALEGKRLALLICGKCHIVSRDQLVEPILHPPATSFETVAQRNTMTADYIRIFLTTTHRDISNPKGMPRLQLIDDQIERVTAYLLSLQKKP